MQDDFFVDSNVCLYLLSNDFVKKEIAKKVLLQKSTISTQVISENINVIYKKLKHLSKNEVEEHIDLLIKNSTLVLINISTIKKAMIIKEKYQLQWYDSLIVATALQANCTTLYTEDMHHGLVIESTLSIINPFV